MHSKTIGFALAATMAAGLTAAPAAAQQAAPPAPPAVTGAAPAAAAPAPNMGGGRGGQAAGGRTQMGGRHMGGTHINRGVAQNNWRGGHRWRGDGGRHQAWRNRGGFGPGFAAGVAIGASPYWAPYGYDSYAYGGDDVYLDGGYAATPDYGTADVQYCIDHFKSYDIRSQTYLGYDGERHSCP